MSNETDSSGDLTFTADMNGTEFNCLSDDISSSRVTNQSFWEITLSNGAPVVAAVLALYFLVAFGWNLFIIITFLTKRKMLREAANILLLNLAIADLMVALTQMLFGIVTESSSEFVFGNTDSVRCGMCNFVGVFFMLVYGVSMHTLAALSFDRFLLLYKPFHYKKWMRQRNTVVLVLIIWFISIFLAIPPTFGFGQIEFNGRFGSCVPRFTGNNLKSNLGNFYYVAYVSLESLFPIITISVCSFWTYWFVNKFLKRNYRRRSFYNRRGLQGEVQQRQEDSRYHHQQQQLVKVFSALLVSTVISWSPVLIVIIVVAALGSADKVPDEVYVVGWICYLSAPVCHPIIESFFVRDMRLVVCKGYRQARGAGSFIARSTTNMFGNKDIEMANKNVDDDNDYVSKRKIKFFGGRNRVLSTVSATTEVTDIPLPTSHDNTPSPSVTKKLKEANEMALRDDVHFREKQSSDVNDSKLSKRITFSDEPRPPSEAGTPVESSMRNGVRKSVLKSPRANARNLLTPVDEIDARNSPDSSSGDGSVFNSPDISPQGEDKDQLLALVTEGADEPVEERTGTGWEGQVDLVPTKDEDPNETITESSDKDTSDLRLLETLHSERRGSLTLV